MNEQQAKPSQTTTVCHLKRQTGSLPTPVEQSLAQIKAVISDYPKDMPAWHWLEPSPALPDQANARTYRLDHHNPLPLLAKGEPPTAHAVQEMRLFWPKSSLHVLKQAQGCRWVYWQESNQENGNQYSNVLRKKETILLRQDIAKRFAKIAPLPEESFQLIEYRNAEHYQLITWLLQQK